MRSLAVAALLLVGCVNEDRHLWEAQLQEHIALDDELRTTIWDVLSEPDSMELLSIDHRRPTRELGGATTSFHGYEILGSTAVSGRALQQRLVGQLYQGIREGGWEGLCFIPHHGLSAMRDGRTIDLVICFHCLQIEVYDGHRHPTLLTTRLAQPLVASIVREAGLSIDEDEASADEREREEQRLMELVGD